MVLLLLLRSSPGPEQEYSSGEDIQTNREALKRLWGPFEFVAGGIHARCCRKGSRAREYGIFDRVFVLGMLCDEGQENEGGCCSCSACEMGACLRCMLVSAEQRKISKLGVFALNAKVGVFAFGLKNELIRSFEQQAYLEEFG
jgi:hypothetical protein